MTSFKNYEANDFSIEDIKALKGSKKLYVIFSTFGTREADLIYDKISLLKKEFGNVIDRFFLSHRRAGSDPEITETKAREADSEIAVLVCNSFKVPDMKDEKGKGSDMRRTLYYINREWCKNVSPDDVVCVFLDADVVPDYFGAHFVTALSGAVMSGNDFAKASFWRAMGRVKKYVAQPLFSAIKHPGLDQLKNYSYPLSGEVAATLAFFNKVNFWQIYGVETGIDIDACMGDYSVADVNLGKYDHEHHGDVGIQKMSFGIIRTYLKQLVDYGIIELKDGAVLSDTFSASYIDEDETRKTMDFDLTELKYQPLNTVVRD